MWRTFGTLQEVPEQTVAVARAAFPKGTLAMRVRDELPGLFADAEFASAFGVRGKPGISPGQLAMVTVLQFAENLTDRQAADAVRGRIDWKYALGLELTDPGFDHTVLTGFRQRLIDHGLEEKGRSQAVSASAASISTFSRASVGVLNPSVFRGLRFSLAAISSSSVW
jgi:transposase